MGHWEQIGEENIRHREKLAAMTPWQRRLYHAGQLALLLAPAVAIALFAYIWVKLR